jgi:hypothetical protein
MPQRRTATSEAEEKILVVLLNLPVSRFKSLKKSQKKHKHLQTVFVEML